MEFLQYKEAWSKTSIKWGGVKTFVNKRWMVCPTVMIRCALERPYLGQPFKYLERHHITRRKNFRATWSQKVRPELMKKSCFFESQLRLSKFLNFRQLRAHFLTSGGSKNFFYAWCDNVQGIWKIVLDQDCLAHIESWHHETQR